MGKRIFWGIFILLAVFIGLLLLGEGPIGLVDTKPTPIPLQEKAESQALKKDDLVVGTGEEVKSGDTIAVHYKGTFIDGKEFESSYGSDPFVVTIGTGQVIEGWDQGIPGMKVGGKRKLTIPAELAYGEIGSPPNIRPNTPLVFEVEVVEKR